MWVIVQLINILRICVKKPSEVFLLNEAAQIFIKQNKIGWLCTIVQHMEIIYDKSYMILHLLNWNLNHAQRCFQVNLVERSPPLSGPLSCPWKCLLNRLNWISYWNYYVFHQGGKKVFEFKQMMCWYSEKRGVPLRVHVFLFFRKNFL